MKLVYISEHDSYSVGTVSLHVFSCARLRQASKRRKETKMSKWNAELNNIPRLERFVFTNGRGLSNFSYIRKHFVAQYAIEISLSEVWRSKVLWQPGPVTALAAPGKTYKLQQKSTIIYLISLYLA
jgi:hypothetical protein